jgi:integrase
VSSIERRTNSDGTESVRVRFRYQGRNKAETFDTEDGAVSWQAILEAVGPERALALLDAPREHAVPRTVAQQVENHIAHLTGVTEGTRAKYRRIAHARLDPVFGRVLLGDLTRAHVSAWMNAQTGAPKTIRNAHSILSGALSAAVRDGLIPANPAKGVRTPRRDAEAGEHTYLTHGDVAVLLRLIPDHWRPFVVFLVGTGVRFSEATALTVEALDLETGSARIHQAWKDTSGVGVELGPPKTAKSRRTIGLPPELVGMLRIHVAGRKRTDWLFPNVRDGNPIRNAGFHKTVWQKTMPEFERVTGKRPRIHDLRHTYASWAIRAGIPLPVIQRQLGHESIQTTVDTYGHLVRSDLDALAVTIGKGLPQIEG